MSLPSDVVPMTTERVGQAVMQGIIDHLGKRALYFQVNPSLPVQTAEELTILYRGSKIGVLVLAWQDLAQATDWYAFARKAATDYIATLFDANGTMKPETTTRLLNERAQREALTAKVNLP